MKILKYGNELYNFPLTRNPEKPENTLNLSETHALVFVGLCIHSLMIRLTIHWGHTRDNVPHKKHMQLE